MNESKPEGIKITDRRHFHADGTPRSDEAKEVSDRASFSTSDKVPGPEVVGERSAGEGPSPPVDFLEFLTGLVGGAASQLGLLRPPGGEETVDMEAAKHMIDLLTLIQEKTKGNLTPEEDRFLQNSLTELRLAFVRVASQHK